MCNGMRPIGCTNDTALGEGGDGKSNTNFSCVGRYRQMQRRVAMGDTYKSGTWERAALATTWNTELFKRVLWKIPSNSLSELA